jgi:hypothetical protein
MEVAGSSEILVNISCVIKGSLHSRYRENLQSHFYINLLAPEFGI